MCHRFSLELAFTVKVILLFLFLVNLYIIYWFIKNEADHVAKEL
jgi:hypothetical protein